MKIQKLLTLYFFIISFLPLSNSFSSPKNKNQSSHSNYAPKDSAKIYYNRGIKFYKTKNYSNAIEEFKQAINLNPEYENAYSKIFDISLERQNFDKTLKYFEGLIKKHPENSYPYFAVGLILSEKKDYEKAIKFFQKAIQLQPKFAAVYSSLGKAFKKAQKLDEGIEWLEKFILSNPTDSFAYYGLACAYRLQAKWKETFYNLGKAIDLNPDLLDAYYLKMLSFRKIGKNEQAKDVGQFVLDILKEKSNLIFKMQILMEMGNVYYNLGDFDKTLKFCEKALNLSQLLAEKIKEVDILCNIGIVYIRSGEFDKAKKYMMKTLAMYRELNNYEGLAYSYGNLGDILSYSADYDTALVYYEKSTKISRETGNKLLEAQNLGATAATYSYLGEYDLAFENGEDAITIYKELGYKSGISTELGNKGLIHLELGNYTKALEYLKQALHISQELGEKYYQQLQLSHIGQVYGALRDFNRALDYYGQSLKIMRDIGDIDSEAECLIAIAAIEYEKDEAKKSIEHIEQALKTLTETGNKREEGLAYELLANIYFDLAEYTKAINNFNLSINIAQKIKNRFGEATALNNSGKCYIRTGDYAKALATYKKALHIGENLKAAEIIWRAQYGIANVYEKQRKLSDALVYYKLSIDEIESVRGQILLEEHKSSFQENKIEIYKKLINLLFTLHRQNPGKDFQKQAFLYSEKSRARALLDILKEARVNIKKGIDLTLIKQQKKILRNITGINTRLWNETLSKNQRNELLKKLEVEEKKLQSIRFELKRKNPAYDNLKYPEPSTITEIQKFVIGEKELLLEFSLGKKHSYLWAVTKNKSSMYQLSSEKEIIKNVGQYLAIIAHPPKPAIPLRVIGNKLYNLLLKPVDKLLRKYPNLTIVPDEILFHLSFEALITGIDNNRSVYLVENCNVSYSPSASVLRLTKKSEKKYKYELLAFADPVFGNEEQASTRGNLEEEIISESKITERGLYQKQGFNFRRLKYTSQEVKKIAECIPQNKRTIYLRTEASEEKVKTETLTNYRTLHFATHGVLDEERPGRSCIVLTLDNNPAEDGFLQMNEIFNLKLNADLVVLSACQTGRGKLMTGEGVIGLTRAFHYAGANSIVVSLWSVNDYSTAELMETFYRKMYEGEKKRKALRQAKLALISGKKPAFRHPYYWAPFVLMGQKD